jgi:hypothetical protein
MRQTNNRSRLALTAAMIAFMWIGGSNADDGSRNTITKETVAVRSTTTVPSEQRVDLRAYGSRFKLATEAIEKESKKPKWTWDNREDDGSITETK